MASFSRPRRKAAAVALHQLFGTLSEDSESDENISTNNDSNECSDVVNVDLVHAEQMNK